jgi:hypothetical protein
MQNLVDSGVNTPTEVVVNYLQHEGCPMHIVLFENATAVPEKLSQHMHLGSGNNEVAPANN